MKENVTLLHKDPLYRVKEESARSTLTGDTIVETNTIILNGIKIKIEVGHSVQEWKQYYGANEDSWEPTNWDISIEDLISGAIEPSDGMIYWLIDGRLFEIVSQ